MSLLIGKLLAGFVIGAGAIIPGLSGGILAVSMGLYQPTIEAVTGFFKAPKKNFKFLFPLGVGGVIGLVLFMFLIKHTFEKYQTEVISLFLGLVIGSIPSFFSEANDGKPFKKINIIFAIIGFACAFPLMLLSKSEATVDFSALQNTQDQSKYVLYLGNDKKSDEWEKLIGQSIDAADLEKDYPISVSSDAEEKTVIQAGDYEYVVVKQTAGGESIIVKAGKDVELKKGSKYSFEFDSASDAAVSISNPNSGNLTPFLAFVAGAIVMMGIVLPGVSTSFVLINLNIYESFLNTFTKLFSDFGNNIKLALFAGLGILAVAVPMLFLVRKVLLKYHSQSFYFLFGILVATLVGCVIQEIRNNAGGVSPIRYVLFAALFGLGIVASYFMDKATKKMKLQERGASSD
ncbi:MAG: DUF368 domain-containing protein [Clostridia bacterium]|nr:DUF368 domain-containing protein [Clostridia bacterium]